MKDRSIKEIFGIFIILTLLFSCCKKGEKLEKFRSLTYGKDSILIPEFTVVVNLTKDTEQILKQKNETIKIYAEFIGTPEVHIPEKYKYEFYDELGQIKLKEKIVELKNNRTYTFKDLKVNSDLIKLLKNRTYNVRIDVTSGRKSSENNLLDSEHVEKSIDSLKNRTIQINAKLI